MPADQNSQIANLIDARSNSNQYFSSLIQSLTRDEDSQQMDDSTVKIGQDNAIFKN